MSWLAVLLLTVGTVDLCRPLCRRHSGVSAGIAGGMVVLVAALAGLGTGWRNDLALVLVVFAATGWSWTARSTRRGAAPVASSILAVAIVGAVVASPWAPSVGGAFADWLGRLPWTGLAGARPGRVLLACGVIVVQGSTANQVVRLGLALTHRAESGDETFQEAAQGAVEAGHTLRGGRMLGVMERLLIVGMGLAGDYTAAGIVIAAKGLLRFPELQAAGRASGGSGATGRLGVDALTEYFLVGSFLSWSVAFASLAVARG